MSSLYQRLDTSRHEIRLLRLYPKNDARYASSEQEQGTAGSPDLSAEMQELMSEVQNTWQTPSEQNSARLDQLMFKIHAMKDKLEHSILKPVDGPLRGSLEVVSLGEAPPFTALSYVWGSVEDSLPFILDGQKLAITQNLDDALRQLQTYDSELLLWIDSLCINQQCNSDRSEQVMQMRNIYSTAHKTSVWLGPSDPDIDVVLQFVESQSQLFLDLNKTISRIKSADVERILDGNPNMRGFFESDARHQLVRGLDKLLNKDYWYRVWVMQEFSVGQDVFIHCGSWSLSVQLLVSASLVINALITAVTVSMGKRKNSLPGYLDSSAKLIFTMLNPSAAFRMFIERQAYQLSRGKGSRPLALSIILFESGSYDSQALRATDPKDKIYALLGIANDRASLNVPVDYSQSVEHIYTQATAMMLRRGHFDYLQLCTFSSNTTWPSWVPDLQRDVQLTPNNVISLRDRPFRVSGSILATTKPIWSVDDPRRLQLDSVLVDTITEMGLPLVGPQVNEAHFAEAVRDLTSQATLFLQQGLARSTRYQAMRQATADMGDEQWIDDATMRLLTADQEYEDLMHGAKQRAGDLTRLRFASLRTVIDTHYRLQTDDTLTDSQRATQFWSVASQQLGAFDMYVFGMQCNVNRRLFMTGTGLVGLAPQHAAVGDVVAVLIGANLPYVLRPVVDEDCFRLVGDAYVHGIMDGEVVDGDYPVQTVELT